MVQVPGPNQFLPEGRLKSLLGILQQHGTLTKQNNIATSASLAESSEWSARREAYLCEAFQVKDLQAVQDVLNSLILSEVIYKVLDHGTAEAPRALSERKQQFPGGLITVNRVQCCLPHVHHRYLLATSPDALYVSFMGTKEPRDLLADANIMQEALWNDGLPVSERLALPAAHRGFLLRARSIPAELLYFHARSQGKRLVLCGHSLGGAVAELCTLRLLRQLPASAVAAGHVECFCFGTPALGNAALATLVKRSGWDRLFYNMTLPEDYVPRILARYRAVRQDGDLPVAGRDAAPDRLSSGESASGSSQAPLLAVSHQPFTPQVPSSASAQGWPSTETGDEPPTITAATDLTEPEGSSSLRPGSDLAERPREGGPLQGGEGEEVREPPGEAATDVRAGAGGWWTLRPSLPKPDLPAFAPWSRLQAVGASITTRIRDTAEMFPTYVHFGRHHAPPGPVLPPQTIPPALPQDRQTFVAFASHRMATYRGRALLIVSAMPHQPDGAPASGEPEAVILADSLAPALHASTAETRLPPLPPPLPPPEPTASQQTRRRLFPWHWGTQKAAGGKSTPAEPSLVAVVEVRGQGLASCTGVRVQAPGGPWLQARVVHRPELPPMGEAGVVLSDPASSISHEAAHQSPALGIVRWSTGARALIEGMGRQVWARVRTALAAGEATGVAGVSQPPEVMQVQVMLPAELARQLACEPHADAPAVGHPSSVAGAQPPELTLYLRSDFAACCLPISLNLPSVWVLPLAPRASADLGVALQSGPQIRQLSDSPFQQITNGVRYTLLPDRDAAAVSSSLDQVQRMLMASSHRPGVAQALKNGAAAKQPPVEGGGASLGMRGRLWDSLTAYRAAARDRITWQVLQKGPTPQLLVLVHDGSSVKPLRADRRRAHALQAASRHAGVDVVVGVKIRGGQAVDEVLPRIQRWFGTGQAIALSLPLDGPGGGMRALLGAVYRHLSHAGLPRARL